MSSLREKSVTAAPKVKRVFETPEHEVKYTGAHPVLAFEHVPQVATDHLEEYVEVDPFEHSEPNPFTYLKKKVKAGKAKYNKHKMKQRVKKRANDKAQAEKDDVTMKKHKESVTALKKDSAIAKITKLLLNLNTTIDKFVESHKNPEDEDDTKATEAEVRDAVRDALKTGASAQIEGELFKAYRGLAIEGQP